MSKSYLISILTITPLIVALYFFENRSSYEDVPTISDSFTSNETGLAIDTRIQVTERPRQPNERARRNAHAVTVDQARALAAKGNSDQAARILAELYGKTDTISNSEKITLLETYSLLLIQLGSNEEAIQVLNQLLAIPGLALESELAAKKLLGETLMKQEEWALAQAHLSAWLEDGATRDPDVLLNLSYAFYQQELWTDAISPAIEHLNLLVAQEQDITRERLAYINSLAFTTQDWDNAAWVTQVLINEFGEIRDWRNLIEIYRASGNESGVEQVFLDADEAGVLEELEISMGMR